MAARLRVATRIRATRRRIGSVACLVLLLPALVLGCGAAPASPAPRPPAGGVALATPVASLTPAMAATASVLREQLEPGGLFRLEMTGRPFRPSEPESLWRVPRAVLQVDIGDPEAGWVVIYEFPDPSTAGTVGQEYARYIASGFGQTNFPLDARFSLAQLSSTLIFTWWSPERAAERERAGHAFELVSGVGQPIPVVR
jgi:hypothetical protein